MELPLVRWVGKGIDFLAFGCFEDLYEKPMCTYLLNLAWLFVPGARKCITRCLDRWEYRRENG